MEKYCKSFFSPLICIARNVITNFHTKVTKNVYIYYFNVASGEYVVLFFLEEESAMQCISN